MRSRPAGDGGRDEAPQGLGRDVRVAGAQDHAHGAQHDYEQGSPHLRHPAVRAMVIERLRQLVRESGTGGPGHVLEVGAGHGTFTDVLLQLGARVTVSEVSEASAEHLSRRYAHEPRVQVVHDVTGEDVFALDQAWSAVVMISVLHHIPDYLHFVEAVTDRLVEGGGFLSVQDPIWYDRRTRAAHIASRGTYFAWRLTQGELRRGLATRMRRLRGAYDETEPSDLVEYHVVRNGVDELAVEQLLAARFGSVDLFHYWSTQPAWGQRLGERVGWSSEFGVLALGHQVGS